MNMHLKFFWTRKWKFISISQRILLILIKNRRNRSVCSDLCQWIAKISKEIVVFSQEFFKMQQPQQGTAQMRVPQQMISSISKEYRSKYKSSVFCPHRSLEKNSFLLEIPQSLRSTWASRRSTSPSLRCRVCECRRIEKLRRRTRATLESKTQRSKEAKEAKEEAREAEGRLERKTGQSSALI